MAQTRNGILKIQARLAGISVEEFCRLVNDGNHWCCQHGQWHSIDKFGKDSSRYDGISAHCKDARRERHKKTYNPVPAHLRKPPGPPRNESREGDKKQARHHVNLSIRMGKLAHPKDLPCMDCGHIGTGRRHEYDHFMGYSAAFHMAVQCVCSRCHHQREIIRGTNRGFGNR
jgi:hypothetical protein